MYIYMIQIIGRGGGRSVPNNLDIYIYIHVYIQCAYIYIHVYTCIYMIQIVGREGGRSVPTNLTFEIVNLIRTYDLQLRVYVHN